MQKQTKMNSEESNKQIASRESLDDAMPQINIPLDDTANQDLINPNLGDWKETQAIHRSSRRVEQQSRGSSRHETRTTLGGGREYVATGREFDRHSGTGRGREMKKDGSGAHNWGSLDEEIKEGLNKFYQENEEQ